MGQNLAVGTQPVVQGAFCTVNYYPHIAHQPDLKLNSFHVSCKSDQPKSYDNPGKDYGGVVLYQRGGKNDWTLNGLHCKTGYDL